MLMLSRPSANELFAAVCREVRRHGHRSAPRGMATTEVLGAHLCLTQPRRRFVDVPPVRVLNPAFAVAEALWILSGSDDPWIFTYNRSLVRYADAGRLQGAYGPRMRHWRGEVDQLDHVRRLLLRSPRLRGEHRRPERLPTQSALLKDKGVVIDRNSYVHDPDGYFVQVYVDVHDTYSGYLPGSGPVESYRATPGTPEILRTQRLGSRAEAILAGLQAGSTYQVDLTRASTIVVPPDRPAFRATGS